MSWRKPEDWHQYCFHEDHGTAEERLRCTDPDPLHANFRITNPSLSYLLWSAACTSEHATCTSEHATRTSAESVIDAIPTDELEFIILMATLTHCPGDPSPIVGALEQLWWKWYPEGRRLWPHDEWDDYLWCPRCRQHFKRSRELPDCDLCVLVRRREDCCCCWFCNFRIQDKCVETILKQIWAGTMRCCFGAGCRGKWIYHRADQTDQTEQADRLEQRECTHSEKLSVTESDLLTLILLAQCPELLAGEHYRSLKESIGDIVHDVNL